MKQNVFKSIISLLLTVSIFFSLSASFFVYAESKSGYINDTDVRVRKTPSTKDGDNLLYVNGYVVKLHTNHSITVIETVNSIKGDTANPTWCYIEFIYNGTTYKGYVASQFVTIQTTTDDFVMPENVPDIYKPYIENLLSLHPNWNFVFYDTGYDWNDLFLTTNKGQCYTERSLIQGAPYSYLSFAEDCFNYREDKFIPHDGKIWYQANKETVAYYMDPRNFLNENTVFMFESLSYDSKTQNIDGVQNIIKNSFMNNAKIRNNSNQEVLYVQAYIDAAMYSKVSPYHLASRTIQEVGNSGSGSTSGNYGSYKGYYNFYNIGASSGIDPISNGLYFAKTGDGLDSYDKDKCMIPWNSQYKSIVGGSYWIGSKYINSVHKQNTVYFQKFNTSNPDPTYFYHQYMQNIAAPANEAPRVLNTYKEQGVIDNNFTFIIPIYRNMPEKACELPQANNYSPNNWLKSLTINGDSINFDSAKTSGYTYKVASNTSSVNIAATPINSKAKITGAGNVTLKDGSNLISVVVKAENGNERTYIINIEKSAQNNIPMTGIKLNTTSLSLFNGDSSNLSVSYQPTNTTDNKTVTWSSSNNSVATVSNGKVTAVGKGEATITAKVGSFTATCKITVNANVILGDIDADDSVTIADALLIFKYKTGEISNLSDLALLAADTDISGKVELADALRIFKFKSGEIDSLFDSKGHWVKDSVGWCYLDSNGHWLYNKWIKDSVGWCYLGSNGHLVVNEWVKDSVGWCYLDSNGRMVINDWVKWNNQWYYLDASGYMVTGTKIIDGNEYYFDSNGVWIP